MVIEVIAKYSQPNVGNEFVSIDSIVDDKLICNKIIIMARVLNVFYQMCLYSKSTNKQK